MKNYLNVMAIIGGSMVCASSLAHDSIVLYCNNTGATDDFYCYNQQVCPTEQICNQMTGTTSRCTTDANGETTCANTAFFTDSEGNENSSSMDMVKIKHDHAQYWTFICAQGSPMSPTHNKYWYKADQFYFTSKQEGNDGVKWKNHNKSGSKDQRPEWMACQSW